MKILCLAAIIGVAFCMPANAQIICIYCYDQNTPVSAGVNNLIVNGSFENHTCTPNSNASTYCPNASSYSCDIADWTCTGGGPGTYASMWNSFLTVIPDGIYAPYFGNDFCSACQVDTNCLLNLDCAVTGPPTGFPHNTPSYGGPNAVTLSQTVTGLTAGNVYVLEFWAGGEYQGAFPNKGLFAIDVGFGDTMLRCKPTGPTSIGSEFIVEFIASSSSHTIKFINWGHICSTCTELILDNVKLYTLAELDPSVPSCGTVISAPGFAASDSAVCQKFCVDFEDQSSNNPISWQWSFPGGNPPTSTDQNPSQICYNTPGTFDVTLITVTASGSDTLTVPGYITVFQTPPFPSITQTGYTLTSSVGISYQWQFNSMDIAGATNQSYDVQQTGYYTVTVTDENGCFSSTTVYIVIDGIPDFTNGMSATIFPNPAKGMITVEIKGLQTAGSMQLKLLNTLGQTVFISNEKSGSGAFTKTMDLSAMPAGIYSLEIKSNGAILKKKVIIEK
jgi:hypothetical protein